MGISVRVVVLALATGLVGKSAFAQSDGHMCWISDVQRERAGVRIEFGEGGPMFVNRGGENWFPDREKNGRSLIAKIGETLYAGNSHHDFCKIEVVEKDGKVGVRAKASLNLPGLPSREEFEFIPAKN
jgi:hypothetical protein